jgi:hypothetical protein
MAAMLAQSMLALSLIVRVYDAYGVPDDHLASARTTVEGIMKPAGVVVTWSACPCLSPISSNELVIQITAASPARPAVSLGFSLIDTGLKAGTLATVFADRVQALAASTGVDRGELLGRVMAHEISHLLLGTLDHALRGLMRGEWKASELARQGPLEWRLSPSEGRKIGQAIRRRSSESGPALMIVDADPASPNATAQ